MLTSPAVARRAQIWVPSATGLVSGCVPDASLNRSPPVAVTVAEAVDDVSVNGPISELAGPSPVDGVMDRFGGGGLTNGPRLMTFWTMAATCARRGSFAFNT